MRLDLYLIFPIFPSPSGTTIWSVLMWWGSSLSKGRYLRYMYAESVNWWQYWTLYLAAVPVPASLMLYIWQIYKLTRNAFVNQLQRWVRKSIAKRVHFMFVFHFTIIFTENLLPSLFNTPLLHTHTVSLVITIGFLIPRFSERHK